MKNKDREVIFMFCKQIKIVLIVLLMVLSLFANTSFAMSIEELGPIYTKETTKVQDFGQELFGIIKNIAIISAVVVLAFIGLKFMFGSLEQRAEYKKSLVPLAIGVFVTLSATTITSMVWDFQEKGNKLSCAHEVRCNIEKLQPIKTCILCGGDVIGDSYSIRHSYYAISVSEEYVAANAGNGANKITTKYKCGLCGEQKEEVTWETVVNNGDWAGI